MEDECPVICLHALALLKEQEERIEIQKENFATMVAQIAVQPQIVRCKDCKYYEQKEHWANFGGVPILATEMPTCSKWADGDCATRPDGYCFLAERRDSL
jgi:hypothetical protein